jgi:hypothetical protein
MFGSQILDVAIGVILVYVLLSLICSALREGIEAWFKTRSVNLEQGIRELLWDDPSSAQLLADLYSHPQISGLFKGEYGDARAKSWFGRSSLPSYIPARNFAIALTDRIVRGPVPTMAGDPPRTAAPLSCHELRRAAATFPYPRVQRALLSALDTADGDITRVQSSIEQWYDSAMDRASGWYKRRTQLILLALGLGVAALSNANTLTIADYLYRNSSTRAALVAEAGTLRNESLADHRNAQALYARLDSLQLPIGWNHPWASPQWGDSFGSFVAAAWNAPWDNLFFPIVGWLITAVAISLGAPLWFDLLNKFMVIRSTVKPHEKSPEEASEDRQRPQQPVVAVETGTPDRSRPPTRASSILPIAQVNDPSAVLEEALDQLRDGLWRQGVTSIGAGIKLVDGRRSPCIRVRVEAKKIDTRTLVDLERKGELLPRSVTLIRPGGELVEVPIDVVEDGIPMAQAFAVGARICNADTPDIRGTLGALVRRNGSAHVLTCYHVVRAKQPWEGFPAGQKERVAWVQDSGGRSGIGAVAFGVRNDRTDLALVRLDDAAQLGPEIPGIGSP